MDNLYFKDENENCFEKKVLEYCNCNGEIECVTYYEPLPYKQAQEILAPVFLSESLNSQKYYRNCIMTKPKICGKTLRLDLKYVFKVGDIFTPSKSENPIYVITKRDKRKTALGHFRVYIKRLDKSEIIDLDLNNLKIKTKLIYKGYTE